MAPAQGNTRFAREPHVCSDSSSVLYDLPILLSVSKTINVRLCSHIAGTGHIAYDNVTEGFAGGVQGASPRRRSVEPELILPMHDDLTIALRLEDV